MTAGDPYRDGAEHLVDELARLDLLLAAAAAARHRRGRDDPYEQLRGLVVSDQEVASLLAGAGGGEGGAHDPEAGGDGGGADDAADAGRLAAHAAAAEARLAATASEVDLPLLRLAHRFDLSTFERRTLILCLAPEVDRRYDRLYSWLQDDVTRKRPTAALALELFCTDNGERRAARAALRHGPLRLYRLLTVTDTGQDGPQPLLSRALKLDDRIAAELLGDGRPNPDLSPGVRLLPAGAVPGEAPGGLAKRLRALARRVLRNELPGRRHLVVRLRGPRGSGRRALAAAVGEELGLPLLLADARHLAAGSGDPAAVVVEVVREAFLQPAVLVVEGFSAWLEEGAAPRRRRTAFLDALRALNRVAFLVGGELWRPAEPPEGALWLDLELQRPDEGQRADLWRRHLEPLATRGRAEAGLDVGALASEFRFTAGQVTETVRTAADLAAWRRRPGDAIAAADLQDAARTLSSPALARLARRVTASPGWEALVLPDEQRLQLSEMCDQARHRHVVFGSWGFGDQLTHGKGLSCLFSGPPGTGKTLAASIVAGELGLDLYKVDLSQVVSKYIGETEKNLDRIFTAAEDASAILFFDEADALFGKRSEVRDSHDRYANVEVSYLLQKMEEYEGITVLATNLRQHLDDAFLRRLAVVVEFPFPDAADRERIWRVNLPEAAPLAADVDLASLAREVRLAGGNIKNISLAAAFYAAADGQVIVMDHLWRAAQREFAKLGKAWSAPGGAS